MIGNIKRASDEKLKTEMKAHLLAIRRLAEEIRDRQARLHKMLGDD